MNQKSETLKRLQGTARPDRRKPPKVPLAPIGTVVRPKWLKNAVAKAEFNRLLPLMESVGIPLHEVDANLLASTCLLYARWREAEDLISAEGITLSVTSQTRTGKTVKPQPHPAIRVSATYHRSYLAALTKLGLTTLDRSRIEPSDTSDSDLLDQFLNGDKYNDEGDDD